MLRGKLYFTYSSLHTISDNRFPQILKAICRLEMTFQHIPLANRSTVSILKLAMR